MISGFPGALGSSIKVYVKKYARTRVCVMIEREREIEIEKKLDQIRVQKPGTKKRFVYIGSSVNKKSCKLCTICVLKNI